MHSDHLYYALRGRKLKPISKGPLVRTSSNVELVIMKSIVNKFALACLIATPVVGCGIGSAPTGTYQQRSAGDTVDDQLIVTKIKSQLLADPEVHGLQINVDSFKGFVTLEGFVKTPNEAERAIYLARGVSGVREIRSRLVVQ